MNRKNLMIAALAGLFAPVTDEATAAAPATQPEVVGTLTKDGIKPAKGKKAKAKPAKKAKGKKAKKAVKKTDGASPMAVLRSYAEQYERPKGKDGSLMKTAAGNPMIDCGDEVAQALRGKDLDVVYATVAKRIGVTEKELRDRYGKLNLGQQRMNLGNRLRGHLNAKAKAKEAKAK